MKIICMSVLVTVCTQDKQWIKKKKTNVAQNMSELTLTSGPSLHSTPLTSGPSSRRTTIVNGKWTAFKQRFSNQWPLKALTILPNIHHNMLTFTHRRRSQPCKVTASSSGAVRVRRLTQGHLHTQLGGAVDQAIFQVPANPIFLLTHQQPVF